MANPTSHTTIAKRSCNGTEHAALSGTIDEVSIWNSALSAGDVSTFYSAGQMGLSMDNSSLHYSDLAGYWPLDGALGPLPDGQLIPATVGSDGPAHAVGQ